MSFFVDVKGCVNFHEMTSIHKKRVFARWIVYEVGAFSKNDRIAFKFNSSLFLFYLTNLVSGLNPRWILNHGMVVERSQNKLEQSQN